MIDGVPAQEQYRLLAKVDILEPLLPEDIEQFALSFTTVHLATGESVPLEGALHTVHLLVSGRVQVHEPDPAGRDLTISVVEGGTMIAHTGLMPRSSRPLYLEALETSVICSLEGKCFEDLVCRNPEIGVRTIRLLSERLGRCQTRLSDFIRKEVSARLATLILNLSEEQGVLVHDGSRVIPRRYTHKQLASMVGSNREALTRAFGRLREAGAVDIRDRHIHVTDADALERLAEAGR